MFSSDVSRVVRSFETQTLQSDAHSFFPSARISVTVPGFTRAHAICSLFKLCNSSPDQYDFIAKREEGNKENGQVILFTSVTKAGAKVNAEFMRAMKKEICKFSASLPSSWVPYKIREGDDDFNTSISDIDKQEAIVSKVTKEESRSVYSCLIKESGCKVECGGVQGADDKGNLDLIAGSKKDVASYLGYLQNIGESIHKELAS